MASNLLAMASNLLAMASNLRAMASNLLAMASTFPLFRKILAPQLVTGETRNSTSDRDHIYVFAAWVCSSERQPKLLDCLEPGRANPATDTVCPVGCDML